jgi:hypothetical protein
MADWTDWPAATFVADRTIHAGITRLYLQENLQVAYDESGYDIEVWNSNDPAKNAYHQHDSIATYEVFAEWTPIQVPITPKLGGGWRSILIDAEIRMENGATKAFFAFFAHRLPTTPAISATTGLPDGCTSTTVSTTSLVWERVSNTLAIPDDVAVIRCRDGVSSPMIWIHLASKVTTATHYAQLRSVHISEVP